MSLSDCEKCWDTPCRCGLQYKNWNSSEVYAHIVMLIKVLLARGDQSFTAIVERIGDECRQRNVH